MPSPRDKSRSTQLDVESAERWVSGKSEQELLSDLKVYSARLREDPHGVQDRLRVAAIQLRLGRIEEALIHYEGVLRAYVAKDQVTSAIALCRRILVIYPDIPRLQRILAALYARVPHQENPAPTPVTPIAPAADPSFVVQGDPASRAKLVVDRIFAPPPLHAPSSDLLGDDDLRPTLPYGGPHDPGDERPILLTHPKRGGHVLDADDAGAGVVLLTHPKKSQPGPRSKSSKKRR